MLVAMEGAQQQQAPPWFATAGGAHYPPQPPPQPPPPQPPPPPAWPHPSYAHYHPPTELSQHYGGHPHQQQQHLQHGQFYAQQDQAWPAVGWSQHQWTQQVKTFGCSQEEDWASKARAWATAKSAREANQAPLPVLVHGEAANGGSSSFNSHAIFSRDAISTLSRNDAAQVSNSSHLVQTQVDPSIRNEDVSSNYGQDASNAALGNDPKNEVLTDKQAYLAQEQQDALQPVPSSTQPIPELYEFHQRQQFPQQQLSSQFLHPNVDATQLGFAGPPPPMPVVWPPIAPAMPFPASITVPPPGPSQFEQPLHHHLHPSQAPHMFVRPQAPPPYRPRAPFGLLGHGVGVGGGIVGNPERPRKATVPSWLRDELKKKAAAPVTGMISDDMVNTNGPETAARLHSGTNSPIASDPEGEDDKDEIETVKTAAINQEIKRVLTEVLMKVTDGLFNEIAHEIFDEGENKPQDRRDKGVKSHMSATPLPPPAPSAPTRVFVGGDGDGDDASLNTSSAGNLLGLASYASDDDIAEADSKKADNEIGRQSNSSQQDTRAGVGRIKKDEEREGNTFEKDDKPVQHINAKEMEVTKPNEQGLPYSMEHSPVENDRMPQGKTHKRAGDEFRNAIEEDDGDRGRQFNAKCTEGGKLQRNDKDSFHKKDKQHNKENEREAKSKSRRSEHRNPRKSRNERVKERKDTRNLKRGHHGPSRSPSRSISPNALRRSSSSGSPRMRKLQRVSRCESISQSPRSRRRGSRSRSRSPCRISSPPREKRRHKHSRSRSPGHRRRRR